MSFAGATCWPDGLHSIFHICRTQNHWQSHESRYYGGYDKLLNCCFGDSFEYLVALEHPPDDHSPKNSVNFDVHMVVYNQQHRSVLIAEIKDDGQAGNAGHGFIADEQIRRRYDTMLVSCPVKPLWGLSLHGTSLRVYCGDAATGVITPPYQPHPDLQRVLPRDFLQGEWNIVILSQEGFDKMKEIVAELTSHLKGCCREHLN